jgi:NAD(P)-dependent dehydrogenase (short-subunit alcohol dehydrogenase family)
MTRRNTVLVTGASRGLGYELCRLYLQRGWRVLPLVRRSDDAMFAGTTPGECIPVIADLTAENAMRLVRASISGAASHLDVLINNAGLGGTATRLAEVSAGEIRDLIDVHCLGVLRCMQAALPLLAASPSPKVVNVTSRVASFARTTTGAFDADISYAYRIAKAAQNMLTVIMSRELRQYGITVCALHPGQFASRLNPDGGEAPAVAAARVADWIHSLSATDNGSWQDPVEGIVPW